jgi:hypothetical protein
MLKKATFCAFLNSGMTGENKQIWREKTPGTSYISTIVEYFHWMRFMERHSGEYWCCMPGRFQIYYVKENIQLSNHSFYQIPDGGHGENNY